PGASAQAGASAPALRKPPRPAIGKRLIPYPASRQADMAAYSKRHYGASESRLADPELIVIHYAVAGSVSAIFNTFAPNRPDVEYGELPGVCSHYAVGAKGEVVRFVPDSIRCRHVVGLNHVAIGIEHVGFSDADVLGRKAELRASLRLTRWLRCRYGLGIKRVIGHNESLDSPFYLELDPDFRGRTHADFPTSAMRVYRRELRELGPC
ncbi:MAG: N-acetylmuramoyl-L-alanine amidase, partial [Actinomycetota bacterium]|nr:N-acetylmuramoyl-L-alanine amidase [Actinomycetota bacterium]